MALINYTRKEESRGEIAGIYKAIEKKLSILPNVIQFHSASPNLFPKIMNVFSHFIDHEKFASPMLAYMRMLISFHANGEYCCRFQTAILKFLGETDTEIQKAQTDYTQVNLNENEKAIVVFVLDLMRDKEMNKKQRIEELRKLGWSDTDIYELSLAGGLQRGMVQVIKGFDLELDF